MNALNTWNLFCIIPCLTWVKIKYTVQSACIYEIWFLAIISYYFLLCVSVCVLPIAAELQIIWCHFIIRARLCHIVVPFCIDADVQCWIFQLGFTGDAEFGHVMNIYLKYLRPPTFRANMFSLERQCIFGLLSNGTDVICMNMQNLIATQYIFGASVTSNVIYIFLKVFRFKCFH